MAQFTAIRRSSVGGRFGKSILTILLPDPVWPRYNDRAAHRSKQVVYAFQIGNLYKVPVVPPGETAEAVSFASLAAAPTNCKLVVNERAAEWAQLALISGIYIRINGELRRGFWLSKHKMNTDAVATMIARAMGVVLIIIGASSLLNLIPWFQPADIPTLGSPGAAAQDLATQLHDTYYLVAGTAGFYVPSAAQALAGFVIILMSKSVGRWLAHGIQREEMNRSDA